METVFSFLIVANAVVLILNRRDNIRLARYHKQLISEIARDLNRVTSTIALYAGRQEAAGAEIVPEGSGELSDFERARAKAELWRNIRSGGRR